MLSAIKLATTFSEAMSLASQNFENQTSTQGLSQLVTHPRLTQEFDAVMVEEDVTEEDFVT